MGADRYDEAGSEYWPSTPREYEIAWRMLEQAGAAETVEHTRRVVAERIKLARLREPLR